MEELSELVGNTLLIGITYLATTGEVDERIQLHGIVTSVEDGLVTVQVDGDADPFTLPAEPAAFERASPGEYRLRSTGEVVIDPDYLTSWTVTPPAE